ncbi:ATP-binding cassette sub-family G member 1-like [Oppia nitens]|uniref:ATP-binding cassette sub-family G member 1-like n=1 Tax=Oppia nitens TaxID=1686743 RepID=UPI0023DCE4CF|nr:ATP-binding cassette sub-family G member 1-like [Oppia nitens]
MTGIVDIDSDLTHNKLKQNIFISQNFITIDNTVRRPPTGYLEPFRVTWKGLSYKVNDNKRTILNNVSGSFQSGQIMAIMGPSGSGKSSLLSCICGYSKTGLSGAITISTKRKVKFAFIAQDNYLLNKLSTREALVFASKLKNKSYADHSMIAKNVMEKLSITKCADNMPNRCSGGQLKRLSIALELVSRPNILILDEPTSGLDSVTTWQLINTLKDLTQQLEPVAIVLTIHQPSAKLISLFDIVYLLSFDGQCIYNSSPYKMLKMFADNGLKCPDFTNPSDFALEVSTGEHGLAKVMMLSTVNKIDALDIEENDFHIRIKAQNNTFKQTYLLTIRSIVTVLRDPYFILMKITGYITCSVLIAAMYGEDSGILSGCVSDFNIGDGQNLMKKFTEIVADILENCVGIGFICVFGWIMSIFPVLLIFPQEMNVFLKEYGNGYYSAFAYFMSKALSDIPFQIVLPNLGSIPVYYLTGQYSADWWRIYTFALIFILISFNASAHGFLISAILPDNPLACAFIGLLSIIPMMLLSGLLISIEEIPFYFQYFCHINYWKYALEAVLLNIYGFGRCRPGRLNSTIDSLMTHISDEKLLEIYSVMSDKVNVDKLLKNMDSLMLGLSDQNYSVVLNRFKLTNFDYYFAFLMMTISIIALRLLDLKVVYS